MRTKKSWIFLFQLVEDGSENKRDFNSWFLLKNTLKTVKNYVTYKASIIK